LRGEPPHQERVLRYAQDFGSRLIRLLNASSVERSDNKNDGPLSQAVEV
jgi:hypothetical protein